MQIDTGIKLDFNDVLLRPKRSVLTSRKEVDLNREIVTRNSKLLLAFGIPIVSSNMISVTNDAVSLEMMQHGMYACYPKTEYRKSWASWEMPSYGINDYPEFDTHFICLDTPNGYMEKFVDLVSSVRQDYPKSVIVAGNVVTGDMTQELILAGADIVKVGIGSGAVCTTRLVAGVGMPQLSAVIECADAAHGLGGHVMSDGGCVTPADVVKAFAAGADFVMLGSMLAGHNENWNKGSHFGMSSEKANELYAGGLKDYRAPEGREIIFTESRGPLSATLQRITGGLRSACAYVGAKRLKDLPKCATFVRVNRIYNNSLEGNE